MSLKVRLSSEGSIEFVFSTLDAGVSLEKLKHDFANLSKKSAIGEKLLSAPPDMDENLAETLNRR